MTSDDTEPERPEPDELEQVGKSLDDPPERPQSDELTDVSEGKGEADQ